MRVYALALAATLVLGGAAPTIRMPARSSAPSPAASSATSSARAAARSRARSPAPSSAASSATRSAARSTSATVNLRVRPSSMPGSAALRGSRCAGAIPTTAATARSSPRTITIAAASRCRNFVHQRLDRRPPAGHARHRLPQSRRHLDPSRLTFDGCRTLPVRHLTFTTRAFSSPRPSRPGLSCFLHR